jgi:hypothetical protein
MLRCVVALIGLLLTAAMASAQIPGGGGVIVGQPITGTCPNTYVVYSNNGLVGCQAGGSSSLTVGTTPISGSCTNGYVLYNNAGVLGCENAAGGGNVNNSGTPTNGQIAQWTNATTIQGLATTGSGSAVLATSPTVSGLTVTGSLTATGLVTVADIATQATNTILGNATAGTASPTALAVGTCSAAGSALNWTTNTGFGCNTSITAAVAPWSGITGTPTTLTGYGITSPLPVAQGGTAAASASITAFNNITGFTASGTTGTTSTNLVFSTSPALVTPTLGVASGTSLALGGCTIGSNVFCVTGVSFMNGATVVGANLTVNAGNYFKPNFIAPVSDSAAAIQFYKADGATAVLTLNTTANLVIVNAIASDATHTDTTVCQDTTTHGLYAGSGTVGICLGTSGAQFKTAFAPLTAGIDEIIRLPLWNYRYLPGYGDGGARLQYGLTAQDVEQVIPDLIGSHDKDGEPINYDWGAMVFVSMRAIQQLKSEIDDLRRRVR